MSTWQCSMLTVLRAPSRHALRSPPMSTRQDRSPIAGRRLPVRVVEQRDPIHAERPVEGGAAKMLKQRGDFGEHILVIKHEAAVAADRQCRQANDRRVGERYHDILAREAARRHERRREVGQVIGGTAGKPPRRQRRALRANDGDAVAHLAPWQPGAIALVAEWRARDDRLGSLSTTDGVFWSSCAAMQKMHGCSDARPWSRDGHRM